VIAVVDDHQRVTVQEFGQRIEPFPSRLQPGSVHRHPDGRGQLAEHPRVVGHWDQIDEPHVVRRHRDLAVGDLDGEVRLPTATGANERHRPVLAEQSPNLVNRLVPADE
jgi:hypothetical protein